MSVAENLEAFIKLEQELRNEYQSKLDEKSAQISLAERAQAELQAIIDRQAAELASLANAANDIKRLTQENRESGNRATKLLAEIDLQKHKAKIVRKELTDVKTELKDLKQLDPEKLKKNLKAAKKKIEDEHRTNALLNKSIKSLKEENFELKRENEKLAAEQEDLSKVEKPKDDSDAEVKAVEAESATTEAVDVDNAES